MEKEELYMMNSFFRKQEHRKWTWMSPDGATRNEIDFIMSTKKQIFNDVSVFNAIKTGRDHRNVRSTLNLSVELERSRRVVNAPFSTDPNSRELSAGITKSF